MADLFPNAKLQFDTALGLPNVGGKLYTYDAGTNTPRTTWQDSAGAVPNANPIILDARGECTAYGAGNYKFVLKNALDITIWTQDNVTPAGIAALTGTNGSSLVNFLQVGANAVARSVQSKLRDVISVKDFGAVGDGVTNDTQAITRADAAATSAGLGLYFPGGTYLVYGIARSGCAWIGDDPKATKLMSVVRAYAVDEHMITMTGKTKAVTSGLSFDFNGSTTAVIATCLLALFGSTLCVTENCHFLGIGVRQIGLGLIAGSNNNRTVNSYFECPSPNNIYNQAINISNAGGPSFGNVTENCVFNGTGQYSDGAYTKVVNCLGYGGNLFGSYCVFGPNADSIGCVAIGNTFKESGTGLDVNNTYVSGIENWSPFAIISGNWLEGNGGCGISNGGFGAIITGNVCLNNNQSAAAGLSGIVMYDITSPVVCIPSYSVVKGNTLIDTQGVPTQKYGYAEFYAAGSPALEVVVSDNSFSGNALGNYLFDNTNYVSRHVRGRQVAGKASVSPGTIGAGASVSGSVTVAGAVMGDAVKLGYTQDLQGVLLFGAVGAANRVDYTFYNLTGGSKTLTAGVIRALSEEVLF